MNCYTDHGYIIVESGGLEGTINYRLKDFNGTIIKDSSVIVNISDYGTIYFGSVMEKGKNYMLRIYTPYWSISDSCTANVHDDAVLYLAFDENSGTIAEDFAGDNDGTLSGYIDGTIYGANWTTGHIGNALEFDGENDYIVVPDSQSLNITDGITIATWIYPRNISSSGYLVSKDRDCCDSPGLGGYSLLVTSGNEISGCIWRNSTQTRFCATGYDDLQIYAWQHLVMRFNGTHVAVFSNGSSMGVSTTISDTIQKSIKDLTIGLLSYNYPTYYKFNGTIDDVRIYDRALNDTEIQQLYQGTDVRTGLVGYWGLDEGTGTEAKDTHMWAAGKRGPALYFDETDSLTVTNPQSLKLPTLSVSYWFKPGNWTGASWQGTHIRKYGTGASRPYWTYGARPGSPLTFEMRGDDGIYHYLTSIKTNWDINQFYHIIVEYDNYGGLWKIYVDGELDNSKTEQISPSETDGNFFVGSGFFDGVIDELRIYNRILSEEEVQTIFQTYN